MGPRLYLTWWSVLMATPRWAGVPSFPIVTLRYAGYVLWRGFLLEEELEESQPLASGVRCLGYPGGHGIFYFVPGLDGATAPGQRLVNWGMYVPVAASATDRFSD